MEQNISLEYLTTLYDKYNEFLEEISRVIPVIKVNWSEFQNPKDLANAIIEAMNEIQIIKDVQF